MADDSKHNVSAVIYYLQPIERTNTSKSVTHEYLILICSYVLYFQNILPWVLKHDYLII